MCLMIFDIIIGISMGPFHASGGHLVAESWQRGLLFGQSNGHRLAVRAPVSRYPRRLD